MEFVLDQYHVYMLFFEDNECAIGNNAGYVMEPQQMITVGKMLIATAKKKSFQKEAMEHNRKQDMERKELRCKGYIPPKPKPKAKAHIYIMKCNDKYKIGVSKNVEKRIKQLCGSPYPIEIIYTSHLIEDAYSIEKELHIQFERQRVLGEWFDLSDEDIAMIERCLDEIHD